MEKALIIDDSKLIRRNIRRELEKLGYDVTEAANADEAYTCLEQNFFDVITMDMVLPGASGLEMCGKIKSDLRFESTVVIIVTSGTNNTTRSQCFKSGATGYFTKNSVNNNLGGFLKSITNFVKKCSFDGLKALVVEDSSLQRHFISGLMKKIGLDTIGVENIESAMEILQNGSVIPDLILVDYFFSAGQTCEDLVAYVRRERCFSNVPVIAMTVADDREIRTRLFHLGVNDFFHKPFDVEEFYLRMRVHLQHKILMDDMEKKNKLLQTQAITDGLTGIYNRRYFYEVLNAEDARYRRNKEPYSVIIFDIDHFKRVNDKYGHTAGDEVIKEIASILKSYTREADVAARYGGEEFVALLPATGSEGAYILAEKLRQKIEVHRFNGLDITITSSFGVACISEEQSCEKVVRLADRRLYYAKERGRNLVIGAREAADFVEHNHNNDEDAFTV